ncbi:MAG: alpha/beta hydrolase [Burkholderiaceae bacterium]|nr:alpha/beta hydrolase [Burkholderiaceae bacterium]
MRMSRSLIALFFATALLGQVAAQDASREVFTTSLVEGGKLVRLELLISRPSGPGPFPTVIFNHGSTGRGDNPDLFRRSWSSSTLGKYFQDKGWMVIFPQRRGRGGSDGLYDEGFEPDRSRYSCVTDLSLAGVSRAIEDLDAVMEHVRARSDVVTTRMLIGGQSRGGILAIAYAGERPDMFLGVINFVGGWMGDRCSNAATINSTTFRRGAAFKRPTLWLYGDQDPFYSLSHSKANFEAFLSAGGRGRFEPYWVPGQNSGHSVIAHPNLWSDLLSTYLDAIK